MRRVACLNVLDATLRVCDQAASLLSPSHCKRTQARGQELLAHLALFCVQRRLLGCTIARAVHRSRGVATGALSRLSEGFLTYFCQNTWSHNCSS